MDRVDRDACWASRSQTSKEAGLHQVIILIVDDGCSYIRGSVASSVLSLTRPPMLPNNVYLCPPWGRRRRRPSNVEPRIGWVSYVPSVLPISCVRTNLLPRYPLPVACSSSSSVPADIDIRRVPSPRPPHRLSPLSIPYSSLITPSRTPGRWAAACSFSSHLIPCCRTPLQLCVCMHAGGAGVRGWDSCSLFLLVATTSTPFKFDDE